MIIIRKVKSNRANFGIVNAIKKPFESFGRKMAETAAEQARTYSAAGNPQQAEVYRKVADWATRRPGTAGAVGVGINAAPLVAIGGAGAMYFTRRRRTKNGKIVVEQVRR